MSDAVRTFSSAGRLALGRLGLLGPRQRSRADEAGAGGPRGRLFRKYVLLFIGLVSLVLLVNSALDFWFSYDENKAALFRIQQEKADSAAQRIDAFVDEIERQIGWTTAAQWAAGPLEQRRFDYVRLLRQVPGITELIQLDDAGKEQLKVSRLAVDVVGSEKDYTGSPSFTEAKKHRVWFSPVYFRKESEPYMTLAMARSGRNAGVTVAEVNLKLIWDVITGLKIGKAGYAYVVDRDGRLIAHPDISLVLRNTDLSKLPQVAAAQAEAPGEQHDPSAVTVATGIGGMSVLSAHAAIAPLGWTVFVELPLNEALAPLWGSALRTAALLALALTLATLAALFLARRMVGPIRLLQAGAARIGAGEPGRHIEIHTGDELEGLADQFNQMAGDLQKSYADLEKKVEDRTAELSEALDQQTATAEVLGVINSSPGDLVPVFEAMLEKAVQLCAAAHGSLRTFEGESFHLAATDVGSGFLDRARRLGPIVAYPGHPLEPLTRGEPFVHLVDAQETLAYQSDEAIRQRVDAAGIRSWLAVALRRDERLLGASLLHREEVRPFSAKEISLVQNFAAQAVIAMENARLITETREALEQQTATAEVLGVINSSPGDLAPVFDAMLEKATRLCEAAFGLMSTYDGEQYHTVATHGIGAELAEFMRAPPHPDRDSALGRIERGEDLILYDDIADTEVYRNGDLRRRAIVDLGGAHSYAVVALRKDRKLLGIFAAYRREVRPFTDKQIALLQNFAAQAVIAMENARLITETREALEQQTATAEVLGVINSSPGDLAPVFDAMLEKATRLCEAPFGILRTWDGELFQFGAVHGEPRFRDWVRQRGPFRPDRDASPLGRILAGERVVRFADARDEGYRTSAGYRDMAEAIGIRSTITVALHKDDALLGIITVYRQEVRPFSDKQIALLQNFAAQAVIAMENARLITETREALEQQTATAEVLGVINGSPGDLAPVFDAMLEKAHSLCGITYGSLQLYDGERFRVVAVHGYSESFVEPLREGWSPSPNHPIRGLLDGARYVHIRDLAEIDDPAARRVAELGGIRTTLFVALRKDGTLLGMISSGREEIRPFSEKEIALLENFAAQAVIAMENARLITETREALEQQTATAEVLQVINSSPGDLTPVFDAMLEKAHSLCDAPCGSLQIFDGEQFRAVATRGLTEAYATILRRGVRARLPDPNAIVQFDFAERLAQDPGNQNARVAVEIEKLRTVLFVPLLKDKVPIGRIAAGRQEVRPFTDKQIALLQNFAAQAVIAMENARLIIETREALEQQTATAEVLQVINSSPGDLAPVFETMLEKAMRLCGAAFGVFAIYDDEHYRVVANHGVPLGLAEFVRHAVPIHSGSMPDRLRRGEDTIQVADITALVSELRTPGLVAMIELGNARTAVWVALRKDGVAQGFFGVYRQEVRPFSDKQIALLQNFAAQAVIAMENARLITETREALEQQTATAEVLQVINSSPGNLAPVFDAMLDKAMALCGIAHGSLQTYDGLQFRAVAVRGHPEPLAALLRQGYRPGPGHPMQRLLEGDRFVQIPDLTRVAPEVGIVVRTAVEAGSRTLLCIPLRKDDALLGQIVAVRREVRPFSEKEIALLENFAAQAVIAMENARLITETREALEQQTATAEVLQVINSSPGDVAPVFDAMLEKARALCGAAFGGLLAYDGDQFRAVALRGVPEALREFMREPFRPEAGNPLTRLVRGEALLHIDDLRAVAPPDDPVAQAGTQLGGIRTLLIIPLRKDDTLLGVITSYRQEVRPFSDKQIALLQNFAAQAVIAMENARLIAETREALEQQTATAEVLQVINSSPGDLAPVFDAILEKAHALCGAAFGGLLAYDGDQFRAVVLRGVPEAFREFMHHPFRPGTGNPLTRLVRGEALIHIHDLGAVAPTDDPVAQAGTQLGGIRTLLIVPLRKDDTLLGVITSYRQEVRPFSDKQIALLQNFAAQAVIAMENVRLITELRESLEYQTATSNVLKVISRSPVDLDAVLKTVAETAARLCDAGYGAILRRDGEVYRMAAAVAFSPETTAAARQYQAFLERNPLVPGRGSITGRVALEGRVVQIADCLSDPEYAISEATTLGNLRTQLGVPLLREGSMIGVICLARQHVEPFTEKQIALVTPFADQAVIAIENARLFDELSHRTRDLQESLEYQTATSDVLKVISQSGAALDPVLQTLVETAARICEADKAVLQQLRDGLYHMGASTGLTQEFKDYRARNPIAPSIGTPIGRMALERQAVHIEDALNDPDYNDAEAQRLGQFRTMLAVPLLREDAVIGGLFLARSRVEAFTEKQIGLVTTFADQAVIAIENARLFTELRARTAELGRSVEELRMLSEVGQAVSSTLDLRAVLSTILTRSVGLSGADAGAIFRYNRGERAFRLVEAVGWDDALLRSVRDARFAEAETAMGEAAARRAPIQLADLAKRPSAPLRDVSLAAGLRGVLIVPLVGPERILGALVLQRRAVGEFPPETVQLMQTLASQSVLAIQNARMFREIADKSEQLALASEHKSQFLANMSHELRTPLNAILGYGELLVDGIYGALPQKAQDVLERVQNNGKHLLALINDVLDLAKIEAGQLTLTIENYSLPELVQSVVTATEPLATGKGLKFTAAVQDNMPMAHGDARRLSQVLLNLVGNAIKFTDEGEVEIRAAAERGQFVLTVRDTGPGIADADQERIFGEFQQIDNTNTRKQGGTGLGLAISKRMVEMQGGMISVDSVLGRGSTFRVVLPVHVDEVMEAA